MKFKDYILESIIDIPRRTYAPKVVDDADTKNPKIKDSVMKQISTQLKEFESEYPILKTSLIGSILTKRYRNDADLDINVLFDVPTDKQEEERTRLSKKYLSAKNPDNIQGKLIPGQRPATTICAPSLRAAITGSTPICATICVDSEMSATVSDGTGPKGLIRC